MPIGTTKVGLFGGKPFVPAGSETFNSSGTFTAAEGLEIVTVARSGSAGSAGNSGNSGNGGAGGSGGAGGQAPGAGAGANAGNGGGTPGATGSAGNPGLMILAAPPVPEEIPEALLGIQDHLLQKEATAAGEVRARAEQLAVMAE